jgi:hypothetical protein
MRKGQKWRCTNRACRAEMVVIGTSKLPHTAPPRCGCGSPMKRQYEKPMVRKIILDTGEFLGETPSLADTATNS